MRSTSWFALFGLFVGGCGLVLNLDEGEEPAPDADVDVDADSDIDSDIDTDSDTDTASGTECVTAEDCPDEDADLCTVPKCHNGSCEMIDRDCSDDFACTHDTCDPASSRANPDTGCVHTPMDEVCDDGNLCEEKACQPFNVERDADGCVDVSAVDCGDIECSVGTCDPETGRCRYVRASDSGCLKGEICVPGTGCLDAEGNTCETADDCGAASPCSAWDCDLIVYQLTCVQSYLCDVGEACDVDANACVEGAGG